MKLNYNQMLAHVTSVQVEQTTSIYKTYKSIAREIPNYEDRINHLRDAVKNHVASTSRLELI